MSSRQKQDTRNERHPVTGCVAGTSTDPLTDEENETQRGAANREDPSSMRPNTSKIYFLCVEGVLLKKRSAEFKYTMPMAVLIPPTQRKMRKVEIKGGSGLNLFWLKYLTFENFTKA